MSGPIEVWQDEDGRCYWCEGHVEPAAFVLACVVDTFKNCGSEEAGWLLRDTGMFLDSVQHTYFRMDPNDEERMVPCKRRSRGAGRFTLMPL